MAERLENTNFDISLFVLSVLCKIFNFPRYKKLLATHLKERQSKEKPPFKYVFQQALEALDPDSPELKRLTEELKCPSLLSHYTTLSEWQFGLDKLFSFNKTIKRPQAKTSYARIVYQVSPETFDVTPYRQKSKDGITWSKGTAVSLSSFAQMLPEMDETDKLVAAKVERINARAFRLRGADVLYELVESGRTLVMLDPDIPYKIHRDRLRIEMKKDDKEDFSTTTNLDFAEALRSDQHFVYQENGSILTVYKLTEKELKVLELLQGVRKLPNEAKTKLSEILENLSAEIPVSSELLKSSTGLEALKASSKITFQIIPDSSGTEFNVRAFVRPAEGCDLTVAPGDGLDTLAALIKRKPMRILRDLKAERANG